MDEDDVMVGLAGGTLLALAIVLAQLDRTGVLAFDRIRPVIAAAGETAARDGEPGAAVALRRLLSMTDRLLTAGRGAAT